MSSNQREVAVRVFATEYDDATLEYAESDEERAPNYVVTPTGARINRLFVVGVLTAVESVNENTVRARVADPTGAFVVYAGQYQPDERAVLERTEPPAFVAVTGKANTFQPDGSDRILTSVRPESINTVDADTRDRWVVRTAQQTLSRIETMARALNRAERGPELRNTLREQGITEELAGGITRAIDHYEPTADYLAALSEQAKQALAVVAGDRDETPPMELGPSEGTGTLTLGDVTDVAPDRDSVLTAGGGVTEATEQEPAMATDTSTSTQADTAEPATDTDRTTATEAETDSTAETEADAAETESEPEFETGVETTSDIEDFEDIEATDTEPGELYEVDEDERERIEQEHGLDFTNGSDVEAPGEANIDVPEPEPGPEPESEPGSEPEPDSESEPASATNEPEKAAAAGVDESDEQTQTEDVDPETALLDALDRLDEGDGVQYDTLIETVSDNHGFSANAIEDAIDDALMGGKCYEPEEGRLRQI